MSKLSKGILAGFALALLLAAGSGYAPFKGLEIGGGYTNGGATHAPNGDIHTHGTITADGGISGVTGAVTEGDSVSGDVTGTFEGDGDTPLVVVDNSHAHDSTTVSNLDISADTNLSAGSGITLTGDALSHTTGAGYNHVPAAGSANQFLQYSSAGTAAWATLGGDASLSGVNLVIVDDSHAHTTATISGLDISDDTNLSGSGGIVLTGDALSHSTADGYKHLPSLGASTQILQYTSAGTAKWITVSGDASVADNGAMAVADDSHAHTGATVSGLDVSDDTNLSAGTGIVLTGDALSHSTANGYKHVPSDGAANQFLQYSSAGTAAWATMGGDGSLSGVNLVVNNNSHAHDSTTVSGLDISADTNLSAGSGVTLTGDALSHATGDGYTHVPTGGAAGQIVGYGGSAGSGAWITPVKGSLLFTAAGALEPITAPAQIQTKVETATNKRNFMHSAFDAATVESMCWDVPSLPASFKAASTFSVEIEWTVAGTQTGNVVWKIAAVSVAGGESLDAALGTAATVTAAAPGAAYGRVLSTIATLTSAGTPAAGEKFFLVVWREAADGADTLAVDALLLGVKLEFAANAS